GVGAAGGHRGDAGPPGHGRRGGEVGQRPLDVEPAARGDDHLGPRGDHLVPREGPRGLALAAEALDAAGQANQLGAPVAARKRRGEPFEKGDPRPPRAPPPPGAARGDPPAPPPAPPPRPPRPARPPPRPPP